MSEPRLLDSYQHHIRRLTAENERLREELATVRVMHQREARKLRAQRDEGLAPEVMVLRRELRHWKSRAQAAEARLADIRRNVS